METTVERRRDGVGRRRLDHERHERIWLGAALGLFLVAVILLGIAATHERAATQRLNRITVKYATLQEAVYGSCHRLNIERAVQNRNDWNIYRAFATSANLTFNNARLIPAALRQINLKFAHQLLGYANSETWTPLTVCTSAVPHSFTYIPPNPIPFSQGPPRQDALQLGPGN